MSHPTTPAVRAYGTLHTVRALEALAGEPLTASELGARIGVDERTARRILRRLVTEGYATQGDWTHRRFAATTRLAAVGHQAVATSALVRLAGPTLAALARHGEVALWIRGAAGATALRVDGATLGGAVPLAGHAAGLALLGAGAVAAHAGTVAAPVVDQGVRVAAVSLTPPRSRPVALVAWLARISGPEGAAVRVRAAGATLDALLRDGVL